VTDLKSRTDWSAMDHQDPDDLHLERRRLVGEYLKAREAWEDGTGPAYEYLALREAVVHALVALGEYTTDTAARSDLDALKAGFSGEMFVERWVAEQGLMTALGSREIALIAEDVRGWIAAGACLDDLPMWELAAPHLGVEP
jgi:hypothetical protein